jgi:PEP-CTERM motif
VHVPPILRNTIATRLAAVLIAAFVAAGSGHVQAATIATIDFENEPALPQQPSTFIAAGPMQTYSRPGVFTISGGVVLGNPSFLAVFPTRGTPPNAYGTSDLGDASLLPAISLVMPVQAGVFTVQGVLFNGQPISEMYTLSAFFGTTQVDLQSITLPPVSSVSDYYNFALNSSIGITRVDIRAPKADLNGWDFFVDTIQLATPEPSSEALLLAGLAVCGAIARRRKAGS